MTPLTELDYDSIENAVMATARGRWFLAEHKKRHGGSDTPAILEAIAKLEKVISSINVIKPVAEFEPASPVASTTPAFAPAVVNIPASANVPASASVNEPEIPQAAPASDENLQFFSNDEDLFADDGDVFLSEPTVAEEVEAAEVPETQPEAKTDRFKIFKTPHSDMREKAEAEKKTEEVVSTEVPDIEMQPTEDEQDRIVVIRNTAGEDIDIPLADELSNPSDDSKSAAN